MRFPLLLAFLSLLIFFLPQHSFSHSGGLASDGCHFNHKPKVCCGPKGSDVVYEKEVFRVTITPQYDETKSPLDIRVVPWTDEMGY
jgi:hypothetical protein